MLALWLGVSFSSPQIEAPMVVELVLEQAPPPNPEPPPPAPQPETTPTPPPPQPVAQPKPEPVKPAPKPRPKPAAVPLPEPSAQALPEESAATQPVASSASSAPSSGRPSASGQVVGATAPAAALVQPKPPYPRMARKRGWQGLVVLRVQVDEGGVPCDIRIHQSSGFELLDEAAREAVKNWTFRPALKNGKAVASAVDVPLRFSLTDS
jgi:protein TonB